MNQNILPLLLGALLVLLDPAAIAQESEILVGQDSAGSLKIDIEFPLPLPLPASIYAGIPGYATGELGFHSAQFDDPIIRAKPQLVQESLRRRGEVLVLDFEPPRGFRGLAEDVIRRMIHG